jgi:hypothetical protein
MLPVLRKIVGFEAIRVSGNCGGSAAGIVSARHPVYLLSKLAKPGAPENPKYLPLICPCGDLPGPGALYWHYRRIPLIRTGGIQLFVYPPAEVCNRPLSHALIGQLFACLTPRSDPWIRERSQSLYDGVFASLAARSASPRLHLLDMACGSAKITMTLCRKASAAHRKSFDLTLVDVVRGSRSIANAFYRNPRVFGNVVFRQESLFDWVDKYAGNPPMRFDDAILVLPSGRSLIAQLLKMANHLVIEDADLLPCQLEHHFQQFALGDLSVTDLTDQAKRRGAAVYLIGRKQHDDSSKPMAALLGSGW